jgi:hypothetical protein
LLSEKTIGFCEIGDQEAFGLITKTHKSCIKIGHFKDKLYHVDQAGVEITTQSHFIFIF